MCFILIYTVNNIELFTSPLYYTYTTHNKENDEISIIIALILR